MFLAFTGNRIGKIVKIDKNTLPRESGKYARLCVEVDLMKPFWLYYKIEYEGLLLLCATLVVDLSTIWKVARTRGREVFGMVARIMKMM